MARTKIDPVQVGWSEILTGSLAGPASFLGLNASGEAVLVAASDYVAAGGGGSTAADDIAEGDGIVNITTTTGSITLDTPGDIILSADGGNVKMDDGTTTVFDFDTDNVVFKMMDDADTGDYMSFTVGANGSTVAATNDDDGFTANLTFDVDGAIYLDAYAYGTTILREGAQEYLRFQRASSGTDHAEIQNMENAMDLVFKQYDGTETLRLTDDGDVKVAADIYVDKIRRASDSGTTTKILLNDEAIKLYAGHSTNNICTIDATGLNINNGDLIVSGSTTLGDSVADNIFCHAPLTASNGMKISNVPTGSLAGPASFLGLDTTGRVVQAAASDYVSAGGGSKTFSVHLASRLKVGATATSLYTRTSNFGATLGGDWSQQRTTAYTAYSEDGTSFTDDLEHAWNYYGVAMAPFDCTLDEVIVGMFSKSTVNDAPKYDIWKASPTEAANNDSDLTWTRLTGGGGTNFYANAEDNDESHYVDKQSLSSGNSLSEGDMISFTWRTGGSSMGSTFNMFTTTMTFTES